MPEPPPSTALPPAPLPVPPPSATVCDGRPWRAAATYDGRPAVVADPVVTVDAGTDADRGGCLGGEETLDSFESGALRREAISTVAVRTPKGYGLRGCISWRRLVALVEELDL